MDGRFNKGAIVRRVCVVRFFMGVQEEGVMKTLGSLKQNSAHTRIQRVLVVLVVAGSFEQTEFCQTRRYTPPKDPDHRLQSSFRDGQCHLSPTRSTIINV